MNRGLDLPLDHSRRALALLAAAALLMSMLLGLPTATRAVTTLASDSFTRTIATPPGGWGSLDTGGSWLITNGNDLATDVDGTQGQFRHTVMGSELKARAQDFNAKDVTISAKFRAEAAPNDAPASTTEFILYARYDAEPDFCCYLRLVLTFNNGTPAPVLRVDRQAGTYTAGIATVSLPATNNDSTVAWMVKFETVGSAVRGKAWVASGSEPASWQIDITDTQVTGTGQDNQFVVSTFTNDVNPSPMVIDVDDVLVLAATAPTDTTPPTITSRSPLANATGVSLTPTITAQFSEPVTGVSTASMAIAKASDLINLPATVGYNAGTRTASLTPSSPLQAGTTYRVALSGRIKDVAGNPLAWTTWFFTTASGTTNYNPPAPVTFLKGTHTGYQFNASGGVTAIKTFTLANNSGSTTTQRKAITNQSGMWLAINGGVWAGYWVRESSVAYVTATPISPPPGANATFSPAKSLAFSKGTHTGYQFNGSGGMTAQKTFTLANNSTALTTARTTITNQSGKWFLISSGVWAGYWVRASDVVYLP